MPTLLRLHAEKELPQSHNHGNTTLQDHCST
jgi:hypothetical protein